MADPLCSNAIERRLITIETEKCLIQMPSIFGFPDPERIRGVAVAFLGVTFYNSLQHTMSLLIKDYL